MQQRFLGGIAAISLAVGGIGIMNIMLVTVTERTREIGIRKALGAREGIILRQFVIEAATTSALGGGLGIILLSHVGGCYTGHQTADGDGHYRLSLGTAVLAAFGISAGIGILFGYLPAKEPPASIPSKPCGMTDRRYLLYEIKSSLSHSGCVHALLAIGVPGSAVGGDSAVQMVQALGILDGTDLESLLPGRSFPKCWWQPPPIRIASAARAADIPCSGM